MSEQSVMTEVGPSDEFGTRWDPMIRLKSLPSNPDVKTRLAYCKELVDKGYAKTLIEARTILGQFILRPWSYGREPEFE